jgi:single-strand DNA-binding protein
MAYNEVTTTAIGRVATDVSVRTTAQGKNFANFGMVTTERRFDRESNLWLDGDSLFFSVTCWGWTATNVQRSLSKGDPVMVTGRLNTREYESSTGEKRTSLDLTARAIGPDLSACTAVITKPSRDNAIEAPLPLSVPAAA